MTGANRTAALAVLLFLLLFTALYMYHSCSGVSRIPQSSVSVIYHEPSPVFQPQHREVKEWSDATDHPDMQYWRRHGRVEGLPTAEEVKTMDNKELQYIYNSYLDNINYLCRRKIRMGLVGDGGWEVCDDFQFRPIKPCVVYSFGIHNDFSFDDDVGRLYGCDVFAFDPSMHKESHKRSDRVWFYNVGLGGAGGVASLPFNSVGVAKRERWKIDTLTGIKAMLQHQNTTLDILKMDIEVSEWPALADFLAQGELRAVRQFFIEFHYNLVAQRADDIREAIRLLAGIEALGFKRFHTHINPKCLPLSAVYPVTRTYCYEVYYLNTRLARHPPSH